MKWSQFYLINPCITIAFCSEIKGIFCTNSLICGACSNNKHHPTVLERNYLNFFFTAPKL